MSLEEHHLIILWQLHYNSCSSSNCLIISSMEIYSTFVELVGCSEIWSLSGPDFLTYISLPVSFIKNCGWYFYNRKKDIVFETTKFMREFKEIPSRTWWKRAILKELDGVVEHSYLRVVLISAFELFVEMKKLWFSDIYVKSSLLEICFVTLYIMRQTFKLNYSILIFLRKCESIAIVIAGDWN